MRRFPFQLAAAALLACAAAGRGDTVTVVTGKTFVGKAAFDAKNALSITLKDGPAQRIDLRDVIALKIDPAAPAAVPGAARVAVLIDGTRIAAADVLSLDDRVLRLKRPDGAVMAVNAAFVSSIDFSPSLPHAPAAAGFVGAQVAEKDFTEGDIVGIAPGVVKVSSVLFGVQELDTAKSVRVVYLRPPGISKAAYVVMSRDGSSWQATAAESDAGKLTLQTDLAGTVTLAAAAVSAIDLGHASADDLAGFAAGATAAGGPLLISPAQQQTFNVAQKYRAVTLTFRVPDLYMPLRSARLVVLADQKEIAKSDALTSIDAPVTITRSIENVKQLTFRLETSGPAPLGIAGVITGGRLIYGK